MVDSSNTTTFLNNSLFSANTTVGSTFFNDLSNSTTDFASTLYDATTITTTTENSSTELTEQNLRQTQTTISSANFTKITDVVENITKVIDLTVNFTQSSIVNFTTKTSICSTTEEPFDEFGPPEGVQYIFVPLGVMVFVIILSAVVLIISRKRKLERLRHRLMPLYNFDPGEEGEEDWETELLDENFDSRQKRQGYQSMDTEENAELFSSR